MSKQTLQRVREAYEQCIRAFNAHDSMAYWRCYHWPHTTINGSALVVNDRPSISLDETKRLLGYAYQQIVTLQVVAYSEHTAHVIVRLACLDMHQKEIAEYDMVYIYKKIYDAWKIYVVSDVNATQSAASMNADIIQVSQENQL